MEAFLNQSEARSYVTSIPEATERILVETAVSRAISFLGKDPHYLDSVEKHPMDLLSFARAFHAWVTIPGLLREALTGRYGSSEELTEALGIF